MDELAFHQLGLGLVHITYSGNEYYSDVQHVSIDYQHQNHLGYFVEMQTPGPPSPELQCLGWGLGFCILTGSVKLRALQEQVARRSHPGDGTMEGLL